jgi:tRNA C32,U32 (ribose-2'-O)-methylase TrmJ
MSLYVSKDWTTKHKNCKKYIMQGLLRNVRIVLVNPQGGGNLGAVCRAMQNNGIVGESDNSLAVVVSSSTTTPTTKMQHDVDLDHAQRMACHAQGVLLCRQRYTSIAEAVADCVVVAGTSSRIVRAGVVSGYSNSDGEDDAGSYTPREFAEHMVAMYPPPQPSQCRTSGGRNESMQNDDDNNTNNSNNSDNANDNDSNRQSGNPKIAIVFGREDNGLSNAELALCTHTIQIPSSELYKSLNLSHAVYVTCYELFVAATAATTPSSGAAAAPVYCSGSKPLRSICSGTSTSARAAVPPLVAKPPMEPSKSEDCPQQQYRQQSKALLVANKEEERGPAATSTSAPALATYEFQERVLAVWRNVLEQTQYDPSRLDRKILELRRIMLHGGRHRNAARHSCPTAACCSSLPPVCSSFLTQSECNFFIGLARHFEKYVRRVRAK